MKTPLIPQIGRAYGFWVVEALAGTFASPRGGPAAEYWTGHCLSCGAVRQLTAYQLSRKPPRCACRTARITPAAPVVPPAAPVMPPVKPEPPADPRPPRPRRVRVDYRLFLPHPGVWTPWSFYQRVPEAQLRAVLAKSDDRYQYRVAEPAWIGDVRSPCPRETP